MPGLNPATGDSACGEEDRGRWRAQRLGALSPPAHVAPRPELQADVAAQPDRGTSQVLVQPDAGLVGQRDFGNRLAI